MTSLIQTNAWPFRHGGAWRNIFPASFHDANELKNTEDHNLKDMGITRQQANVAFYRQFAEKRY